MSLHVQHRYQGDETSLPRELRNVSDSRRGLRARAIRLLYLRCPSLMKRIKPPVAPRYEPYTLQGMRLLLAWHEVNTLVQFYQFCSKTSFSYAEGRLCLEFLFQMDQSEC